MLVKFHTFEMNLEFESEEPNLEINLSRHLENNQENAILKFKKNDQEAKFQLNKSDGNILDFSASGSKQATEELIEIAKQCFLDVLNLPGLVATEDDFMEEGFDARTDNESGEDISEEEYRMLRDTLREMCKPLLDDCTELMDLVVHYFIMSVHQ